VAIILFSPGDPSRWPAVAVVTAGVAAATVAATVVMLAAFRAGTRRQERACSLASRLPGGTAGMTRWISGLYAEPTPGFSRLVSTAGMVPGAGDRREPCA
jgi:hypothetical protein